MVSVIVSELVSVAVADWIRVLDSKVAVTEVATVVSKVPVKADVTVVAEEVAPTVAVSVSVVVIEYIRVVDSKVAVTEFATVVSKAPVRADVTEATEEVGATVAVSVLRVLITAVVAVVVVASKVVVGLSGRQAGRALAAGSSAAPTKVATETQRILGIKESNGCNVSGKECMSEKVESDKLYVLGMSVNFLNIAEY